VPSLKQRISDRVQRIRQRRPLVDHGVRTFEHYGEVKGNGQAGAVTYFAFLSFFPILALAFAVIGYVAKIYPEAQDDLVKAINTVLPGMVGEDEGQISLESIQDSAPGIASIGLLVVLYSGLGWLSSMRDALLAVFQLPPSEQPNLVMGKLRDLAALATIGVILIVSVGVAGVVSGLSEQILDWLGLGSGLGWLLTVIAAVIGLLANMVLFWALFRVLANPEAPSRSLWSGALLGAIGFEVLKQASTYLMASTKGQPAFQAFGIALILVVWINYFSRVVLYAAAWAHTSYDARAMRELAQQEHAALDAASSRAHPTARSAARTTVADEPAAPAAFVAGAAAMLGAVALARKTVKKRD
jgi:membrane protein